MFHTPSNSNYERHDFRDSSELLELVASWDKNHRTIKGGDVPQGAHIHFSDDLANYIRTGVDPTGRYAKPPTREENYGVALGYAFIVFVMLVGLLSGGVGRTLFEALIRLIQGG